MAVQRLSDQVDSEEGKTVVRAHQQMLAIGAKGEGADSLFDDALLDDLYLERIDLGKSKKIETARMLNGLFEVLHAACRHKCNSGMKYARHQPLSISPGQSNGFTSIGIAKSKCAIERNCEEVAVVGAESDAINTILVCGDNVPRGGIGE